MESTKIIQSRLPHDLYIKYYNYISTSKETSSSLIISCLIDNTGYKGVFKFNETEDNKIIKNESRRVKVRISIEFYIFLTKKYDNISKLISDSLRIKFPLKTKKLLVQ